MAVTDDLPEKNSSILNSIKVQLGIPESHTEFDQMIQLDINTAFDILNQIGVGPKRPFVVESDLDEWDQFICQVNTEMVKRYVAMKVREMFDPPSGAAADALTRQLDEITWRLSVAVHEAEREDDDDDEG